MQMSDMLNWAHRVAPGIIVCKDESFLVGWSLTGLDSESTDPDELNVILQRVARGVSELQEGDVLWMTLWRGRDAPAGLQASALSGDMPAVELLVSDNLDIAADGVLFTNKIHVVFRCVIDEDTEDLSKRIEAVERRREMVETALGTAFTLLKLEGYRRELGDGRSFEGDELADLLATMASGRPIQQRLSKQQDVFLDVALAADFEQKGFEEAPLIEGREAAIISVEVWPDEYGLDALSMLETLDFDYRWTVRYVAQSPTKTRALVTSLRRKWRQSGSNMLGNMLGRQAQDRDLHADIMAQSLDGVSVDLGRGLRFGDLSSTITVLADEGDDAGRDLRKKIAAVEQALLAQGFRGRRERINAREAYLGSLPGHVAKMARASSMSAYNFATLIPYRSFWNGERYCPSNKFPPQSPALMLAQSARGELFQFNLHVDDVGHTIVVGPTGAGKSVLLGAIAGHFLKYPDAQVFYFDKHCSSRHLCNAVGGSFIEFGSEAGMGLAPLSDLTEVGVPWAKRWLALLAKLSNSSLSPVQLDEFNATINNMYASEKQGGSLSDVANFVLQDETKTLLKRFVGTDVHPGILNAKSDAIDWKPLTVFEAADLFQYDEATSLLALDYIFQRCERRFDGRPTLVVFDEAAAFLRHEVFRTKIAEWLREVRKKNVAIVLATQELDDFLESGIRSSFEMVNTYMFLPNPRAASEKTAPAYREFGLSDTQIELVTMLEPKRDYYVVKPQGARILDFRFGPVTERR